MTLQSRRRKTLWGLARYTKKQASSLGRATSQFEPKSPLVPTPFKASEKKFENEPVGTLPKPEVGGIVPGRLPLPSMPIVLDYASSGKFGGDRTFIEFSKSWYDNATRILEPLTSSQKQKLLDSTIRGKWVFLEGVVSDVDDNVAYTTLSLEVDGVRCRVSFDKDTVSNVTDLAKDQRVRLIAEYDKFSQMRSFSNGELLN